MTRRALFIDRDGTLNRNPPRGSFVWHWGDWRFLPHVEEALRRFTRDGFAIVVVTNQSGIARGLYSQDDVRSLHDRVSAVLQSRGVNIAAFYFCPHSDADKCACRKPGPGMLLAAAADLDIDLSQSIFAGDSARDVLAGKAAGTATAFIHGGAYPDQRFAAVAARPDFVAADLLDLHSALARR
ncbi:MAG: HAD-IIIA family hydrolase [Planctomycetes bacterium]|nr:HAD-IIIA family hydrolase [Planctomycetota bacterium]